MVMVWTRELASEMKRQTSLYNVEVEPTEFANKLDVRSEGRRDQGQLPDFWLEEMNG